MSKSHWIYPLSKASGCHFIDPNGKKTDTSFESLSKILHLGETEDVFFLSANAMRVEPGDAVYMYYGYKDGDRGIVAEGVVTSIDVSGLGKPLMHFRWLKRRTQRLMKNPVAASRVRDFMVPRQGV